MVYILARFYGFIWLEVKIQSSVIHHNFHVFIDRGYPCYIHVQRLTTFFFLYLKKKILSTYICWRVYNIFFINEKKKYFHCDKNEFQLFNDILHLNKIKFERFKDIQSYGVCI